MTAIEKIGAKPHFLFTGGEPTLHPQLYDFLETVDRGGYSSQLMTNGTRIKEENAQRLAKLGHLTKVQVSLESADPATHDSIYGAGLYRRVLKAADVLRANGVAVTFAVTPMEKNENELQAVKALAESKGAEVKYISLYDLGAARENGLKPSRESVPANNDKLLELMCDKGIAYSEGAFYACPVLVKEPRAKLGDTLEQALSPRARDTVAALRKEHAACQVCLKGST